TGLLRRRKLRNRKLRQRWRRFSPTAAAPEESMTDLAIPATSTRHPLLARLGGIADLLAWPLSASHYVELVNPLWASHARRARVEAVWDETRDARTLTLRPGRGWRSHRAGQHVRLALPVAGAQHVRTY